MKSFIRILISTYCISLIAITTTYSQCACCSAATVGTSYSMFSGAGLKAERKNFLIDFSVDYRSFQEGEIHDGGGEEEETPLKSMTITTLGGRYGISDRLSISLQLPVVFLKTYLGGENGVGDAVLLTQYNIVKKEKFSFTLNGGVELPTGQQKESSFDNTTVVIGSGSFDPIIGFSAVKHGIRGALQLNGLFRKTTDNSEDANYGDLTSHSLIYTYLLNDTFEHASTLEKNVTVGIAAGYYGEWLEHLEEDGVADENSGYYLGFAAVTASVRVRKWEFPLTISQPVIQNLNGDQSNVNVRIRFGITHRF
jgi:hypothetical protein